MNKKKTIILAVLLLLPSLIFADFSYQLDLLSFEPLHKEYTADRDRAGLDFQWTYLSGWEGDKGGVYQNGVFFPFQPVGSDTATDGYDEFPWMGIIHLGETLSLAKNTFNFDHWLSPIQFDFAFQGSLLIGFEGGMADLVGYDGVFFYGPSFRVADKFSMRFGLHHYCTHYGDGTLKLLGLDRNSPHTEIGPDPSGNPALENGFTIYKKYIRMDALALGISIEPVDWLRTYAEVNWCTPFTTEYFDTQIFAPYWKDKSGLVANKDDSYNSLIVNFGVELSYPIFGKWGLGNTTLSYDCHAYEEGQIVYKKGEIDKYKHLMEPGQTAYYDPSLPWEFEHELVLSQEINDIVSFEIGYHHGRHLLNSLYHEQIDSVYIGARVNPRVSVNIVDTSK